MTQCKTGDILASRDVAKTILKRYKKGRVDMKCFLCKGKTADERLVVTKRLIMLMLAFIIVTVGIVIYEIITMALGNRTSFHNLGQICSTLGLLICVLALNVKRKREYEEEIEEQNK